MLRWLVVVVGFVSLSPLGCACQSVDPLSVGLPDDAVIAHRGASYHAPESTRPAYRLARKMGADYLEGDVQRTADGVLVLFHDVTLERTTDLVEQDPSRAEATVADLTLEELRALDAGSWFNAAHPDRARDAYAGLSVLTLDELIDIVEAAEPRPGLYLEIKEPSLHPGIEDDLVALLTTRGLLPLPEDAPSRSSGIGRSSGGVIFQSFFPEPLERLKELAPEVPRVLLVSQEMEAEKGWDFWVEEAARVGQGIGPVGYISWSWNLDRAHERGLVVHPYTLNEGWQISLIGGFGADGFFSDRPELLLEHYGRGPVDVERLLDDVRPSETGGAGTTGRRAGSAVAPLPSPLMRFASA